MAAQRIFLSYCRCDVVEVRKLRSGLLAAGFDVWWDQDIAGGQDWKFAIRKAMRSSTAVLLCLTRQCLGRQRSGIFPEALDAIAVYRELRPGETFLIPIRMNECEIPCIELDGSRTLDRIQYLDFFPARQRTRCIRRIIEAVANTEMNPSPNAATPGPMARDQAGLGSDGDASQDSEGLSQPASRATGNYQLIINASRRDIERLIEVILPELRKRSGDYDLTIEKVEDGSVKLTLLGTKEGFDRLKALFGSGEFSTLLEFPVERIEWVSPGIDPEAHPDSTPGVSTGLMPNVSAKPRTVGRSPRKRPLIGINTDLITRKEGGPSSRQAAYYTLLQSAYYDSLLAVGAIPVMIPPLTKEADLAPLLDTLDGVVLTDGDDLDPREMGQPPHPAIRVMAERRESCDRLLCRLLRQRRIPTLAIGLGMLEVVVSFGGEIHLHLPEDMAQSLPHRDPYGDKHTHSVFIEPGTRLEGIYGSGEIRVNSYHHQGIRSLPPGFRAGAIAPDGLIEAIEWQEKDWFCIGVQWRAQNEGAISLDTQLFEAFAKAASITYAELFDSIESA